MNPEKRPKPVAAIPFDQFAAHIARRLSEYKAKYGRSGEDKMPRNSGARRTPSYALLKAIEGAGAGSEFGALCPQSVEWHHCYSS